MKLFEIGPDYLVSLNKEWIGLIPEFAALLKRDKGSPGDYRGSKKLKATREFTFIYFDLDFASPIREWPDDKRREKALQYAGLEEKDIDEPVTKAHEMYNDILLKSSRSLRTLRAVEKSLDRLDEYYENLNFTETNTKGDLVHKPEAYLMNLKRLNEGYEALDAFRKRVQQELKGGSGIRGKATLGLKEAKPVTEEWQEGGRPQKQTTADYTDMALMIDSTKPEEDLEQESTEDEEDGFSQAG